MAAVPEDLYRLAGMLDDEDEDVALNIITLLLAREDELGDLPAQLQESPEPLIRKRAHQLQAAMTFRRRRRRFFERLNESRPDFFAGLADLHLLWFDRDSRPAVEKKLDAFIREARRRQLSALEDAEYLMRRNGFTAELETTLHPENYCIGTILDQHAGSAALLCGLLRALLPPADFKVVRTLGEFALYDGNGKILLGQGDWRICPAPDIRQMEFWEVRTLLRYAGHMLLSSAVNSDSFRYVLTIAQALSGDRGDGILDNFPYPYGPGEYSGETGIHSV